MKRIILILLSSLQIIFSQNNLSINYDVIASFKKNNPQFKTIGQSIMDIPEGVIDYYKLKKESVDNDLKYLVVLDKYIIGVLQVEDNENKILIDANGDGTLDYYSNYLTIPYWVVASEYKNKEISYDNNNFKEQLDIPLNYFNDSSNPYSDGVHSSFMDQLLSKSGDINTPNRDLYYALLDYYNNGDSQPWVALNAISFLSRAYNARFNESHPLFFLHTLESLINMGYNKEAKELVNNLIQISPDFIPGYVYQWQLETDSKLKEELYKKLKVEYPDHWIVVQI